MNALLLYVPWPPTPAGGGGLSVNRVGVLSLIGQYFGQNFFKKGQKLSFCCESALAMFRRLFINIGRLFINFGRLFIYIGRLLTQSFWSHCQWSRLANRLLLSHPVGSIGCQPPRRQAVWDGHRPGSILQTPANRFLHLLYFLFALFFVSLFCFSFSLPLRRHYLKTKTRKVKFLSRPQLVFYIIYESVSRHIGHHFSKLKNRANVNNNNNNHSNAIESDRNKRFSVATTSYSSFYVDTVVTLDSLLYDFLAYLVM